MQHPLSAFTTTALFTTITALAAPALADDCTTLGICSASIRYGDDIGNSKFGAEYSFRTVYENKAGMAAMRQEIIDNLYAMADDNPDLAPMFIQQAQMQAMIDAQMMAIIPEDHLYIGARASVDVTIFGKDKEILWADGDVRLADDDMDFDVDLDVLGDSVTLASLVNGEPVELMNPIEMTFFDARTTYTVAFIPITVTGEVTGALGILGSVDLSNKVALGVEPYAELTAGATVSVGAACVRAGVGGEVLLVGAYVPSDLKIENKACGIKATYDSDLVLSTMDGRIYVFADYCVDTWDKTLVSWNGVTSDPISIAQGNFCF